MRKLFVVVAAIGLAGPALADGYETAASPTPMLVVSNWTGLYFGASVGWAQDDIGWTYHDPSGAVADRPLADQSTDSTVWGVHIGYQEQWGAFVAGVEATASWTDSDFGSTPCFNVAFNCEARKQGTEFTIGPRLGWTPARAWLFYATGGYASASVETREVLAATGAVNQFSTQERQDGWYIGGGVDYALTPNWIVGVDYRHTEYDDEFHNSTVNVEHRNISLDSDAVRARISVKIDPPDRRGPLK